MYIGSVLISYIHTSTSRRLGWQKLLYLAPMKVDSGGDFWQENSNKNCMYFYKRLDNSIAEWNLIVLALKLIKIQCNLKKNQIIDMSKTSLLGPHESR